MQSTVVDVKEEVGARQKLFKYLGDEFQAVSFSLPPLYDNPIQHCLHNISHIQHLCVVFAIYLLNDRK